MANTRPVASLVNDLKTFTQLCTELDGGQTSLTQIARKLGQSTSGMSDCLERLKRRYGGEPLIDTIPRSKAMKITEIGEMIRKKSNSIFSSLEEMEREVKDRKARISHRKEITIGTSPFILSTMLPEATKRYLARPKNTADGTQTIIKFSESVYIDDTVIEIRDQMIDLAILWAYPGREKIILRAPQVTCAYSKTEFEAAVLFGPDHDFRKLLEKGKEDQWVPISALANELVYVLEKDHRPLEDKLPPPSRENGGDRVEMKNLASIVGSIRAGMFGVSIVPAIHKEFDKYRRDGSAYILPLRETQDGPNLTIRILYTFRGTSKAGAKILDLGRLEQETPQMEPTARDYLKFLEGDGQGSLASMVAESGWCSSTSSTEEDDKILKIFQRIRKFNNMYHISAPRIGLDIPSWHHSTITWKSSGKGGDAGKRPKIVGEMETHKGPSIGRYNIEAELIGGQVICIKANPLDKFPDRDCFVINLNMVNSDETQILGIWSGRDDSGRNPISGPCLLSEKEREGLQETAIQRDIHRSMIHTLDNSREFDI